MSDTRDTFLLWLTHHHGFTLEVPFTGITGDRRFRWDAARPDLMLAVEYQGIGRGHQWAEQQAQDFDKYNQGTLCGWAIVLVSALMVNDGRAMAFVDQFALERMTFDSP